ncbi:hypothetical protein AURDEDRAFT_176997 [Auricularia subglabra TFB-10046 SS5]|uniref:Uncharacterized protein n=1 Tax=Auricularia subglabra (strain TFB-10046 / SS5) TaxID=717982 RepID=J0D5C2_AURST|nr:hypothetical protein AURDEDRAFT_176997 [Auricularia subglabra TFB-10046 SS5]
MPTIARNGLLRRSRRLRTSSLTDSPSRVVDPNVSLDRLIVVYFAFALLMEVARRPFPCAGDVWKPGLGLYNRRGIITLTTTRRVVSTASSAARAVWARLSVVNATSAIRSPISSPTTANSPSAHPGGCTAPALQATSPSQAAGRVWMICVRRRRPRLFDVARVGESPAACQPPRILSASCLATLSTRPRVACRPRMPVSPSARSTLLAVHGILSLDISTVVASREPRPAPSAAGERNVVCAAGQGGGRVC